MAERADRGRLLVVGTPIGNLGDLSPRAGEALRTADLVVAEDTRVAARLLAHLGLRRPTRSFNEHSAEARLPELLDRLGRGETLALTSDAGMPGVSDPGARLVAAARDAGHEVAVVPGPTAVTAAIALAGVEAGGFVFGGFLPSRPASARSGALERLLEASEALRLPLVLYEAPQRVRDLLQRLDERASAARVAVGRELTKRFEEVVVGRPAEVADGLGEPRGEYVVVVSGLVAPPGAGARAPGLDAGSVARAAARTGLSRRSVVDLLRAGGMARRQAYDFAGSPDGGDDAADTGDMGTDTPVFAELLERRELALARRDASLAAQPLADLIHPEFLEFGASGATFDHDQAVSMLGEGTRDVELRQVRVTLLSAGLALLTCVSVEEGGARVVNRASLWVENGGRWRVRFHQGTPVSAS